MARLYEQEAVLREGTMGGHSKTLISLGAWSGKPPEGWSNGELG